MAKRLMTTKQYIKVLKDAPGLHGSQIKGAEIGKGEPIWIDPAVDDGWVLIIGPGSLVNPDGTYLKYKVKAWIEYAHLEDVNTNKTQVTLEIDWDAKSVRII